MKGVIERLPESSWLKLFEDKKLKRSRPNLHFLEILLSVWFGSFQREFCIFKSGWTNAVAVEALGHAITMERVPA